MRWIALALWIPTFYFLFSHTTRTLKRDGRSWLVRTFAAWMVALPAVIVQTIMIAGDVSFWTGIGLCIAIGSAWLWRQPVAAETMSKSVPSAVAEEVADTSLPPSLRGRDWLAEIEFDYRDAYGFESRRHVSVEAVNHEYLQGFCHRACANRTFAINRVRGEILDLATGELLRPQPWAQQLRADPRNEPARIIRFIRDDQTDYSTADPGHEPASIVICFTGFSKADRLRLEAMAESAGMVVRQSVSSGLTHLCTGDNAGEKKIESALDQGAEVIDEADFYNLYATA